MGENNGFLKYYREVPEKRPVADRLNDYKEVYKGFAEDKILKQASRCMDCGVPFCHNGCPLGNTIPDFNGAVNENDWERAYEILSETNNFPEFTGRICPAPCEAACVLGINNDPVTIEQIEKTIIEKAYENGWVLPVVPNGKTGKTVAVIGSGPAGLTAADQLSKAGHRVTIFERNDRIGGLLRYGIPDFKLEKSVIDRRIALMEKAGVVFKVNANVGENIPTDQVKSDFDALVLTGGSTIPRDLPIDGRGLSGVQFAMDYLVQNNKEVAGDKTDEDVRITAKGKHVVVIGGGDTGADCVGTSNREGAASVTQIELLSKPSANRPESTPWPNWPMILRTSSSHEEGCEREWAIMTKEFISDKAGNVTSLKVCDIEWKKDSETGRHSFEEREGSERVIPCDLALLAVGFLHPQRKGLLADLGVEFDNRGNVQTTNYLTSVPGVFAAGDMRRGQSLVVWAMSEGREAAKVVDAHLIGKRSLLESKEMSVYQL